MFNYLDSIERDFIAKLDSENLTDLEYCQRYSKFLQNKPFLSHKGLDAKIDSCFNLCVYDDAEASRIEAENDPVGWRVLWTAPYCSKRSKSEMRILPRTLNMRQPNGSKIRYGNTKLNAMTAVMEGTIKFLQVPETRISTTLPPRTLDYFGESAEIIMIRDNKQCDYLRKIGIKVATIADLPKPDPVVRVRKTSGSSGEAKVEKEATHKALSTWRWVYSERIPGFTQYSEIFAETAYLGSMSGAVVADLEGYVKQDKLILLPASSTGSNFRLHREWFESSLYPKLGFTIAKRLAYLMSLHLVAFLQQLGYGIVVKGFNNITDIDELNREIAKVTKKLNISSPADVIAKAVKNNIYSEKDFDTKVQLCVLDTNFADQDNGLCKASIDAMCAAMDAATRRKIASIASQYLAVRDKGELPTIAALSVSSWYYSTAASIGDHLITDTSSGWKYPYTPGVDALIKTLHSADKAANKAYPLIGMFCNWQNTWPSRVSYIANNRDRDATIQYLEAMQMYNKKSKQSK